MLAYLYSFMCIFTHLYGVFTMYNSLYGAFMHQMRTILRQNMQAFRKAKDLTQSQLAEASDLAIRTIQNIEYGETWPSDDVVAKIADALEVEAYKFFLPADKQAEEKKTKDLLIKVLSVLPTLNDTQLDMIVDIANLSQFSTPSAKRRPGNG